MRSFFLAEAARRNQVNELRRRSLRPSAIEIRVLALPSPPPPPPPPRRLPPGGDLESFLVGTSAQKEIKKFRSGKGSAKSLRKSSKESEAAAAELDTESKELFTKARDLLLKREAREAISVISSKYPEFWDLMMNELLLPCFHILQQMLFEVICKGLQEEAMTMGALFTSSYSVFNSRGKEPSHHMELHQTMILLAEYLTGRNLAESRFIHLLSVDHILIAVDEVKMAIAEAKIESSKFTPGK